MESSNSTHPESTGQSFEVARYLKARELAWNKLYELNLYIEENFANLTEEEVHQQIKITFGKEIKFWHPHKVRFNQNTRCSFKDISTPGETLKKGSPYFIDIGPILDSHEADVGQSFRVGDKEFKNPAQIVFNQLEEVWKEEGLTGAELYEKASEFASQLNCELNEKMSGHRLGDFPHALFHRGGLNEFEGKPTEMLWVLEIHLIHKEKNEGHFYEDILGAPALPILR